MNAIKFFFCFLLFCFANTLTKSAPTSRPVGDNRDAEPEQPNNPLCSPTDYHNCSKLVASDDCEPVQEPNYGCCKMCAIAEGSKCDGHECRSGLTCAPSAKDFSVYGDSLVTFDGQYYCINASRVPAGEYAEYLENFPVENHELLPSEQSDSPDEEMVHPDVIYLPDNHPSRTRLVAPPQSPNAVELPSDVEKTCTSHNDFAWKHRLTARFMWIPECKKDDVRYDVLQCETSFGLDRGLCWCVEEDGTAIGGFLSESLPDKTACPNYNAKLDQ